MFGFDDLAIGSAVVGGIGALKGMLSDSPSYKSPSFSDLDLASVNPELWRELQKQSALADQAEALYNQRRQGPTYAETADMNQALSSNLQRQASTGQLGSAVGNAQQADAEARLRSSLAQRAFQEQQQLLAQAQQARSGYTNAVMGAQNQAMAPLQQQAMANYQGQLSEQQAQNGFFSGLLNGGLSAYGQSQNIAAMKDIAANSPYSMGVPSYAGPMSRTSASPYQPSLGYTPPTYGMRY